MRVLIFILGILLLLVPEILRVYFIMPFPGSQEDMPTDLRQVDIAYWLHHNIWWIRLLGFALAVEPALYFWRKGSWRKRIAVVLPLLLCAVVIHAFNFKFMADKMFYPPKVKQMARPPIDSTNADHLVIAVNLNGEARAYPIELIGFHHQVLDTIGGQPVLVTYCTVCRTGRAYSPMVKGQQETFRLVGMDHFNAMFEDSRTGSWWRQVSGECIEGPLKGEVLPEIRSEQLTMRGFVEIYPAGLIFQPDSNFTDQYADLEGFDDGTIESSLEYRDSASWEMKSWVVGVVYKGQARAYDWNELVHHKLIEDTLAGDRIIVRMKQNGHDFSVVALYTTRNLNTEDGDMEESQWNEELPAYQEFWHSWRTFHPNTTRYEPKK